MANCCGHSVASISVGSRGPRSGQVMDRAVVQPLSVRTSLAGFPCFVAERDEPAQPLEVRVAERSRLEADEDYLEHRPRRRPVVIAVVQPPLRGGNRLVYDFDNLRSWRISRLLARASPALAAANAAPLTSSGFVSIRAGTVASWRATTWAAPI